MISLLTSIVNVIHSQILENENEKVERLVLVLEIGVGAPVDRELDPINGYNGYTLVNSLDKVPL